MRELGEGKSPAPGSTCVFAYLDAGAAYWAHVGDSRLYHLHQREPLFQTRDHSAAHALKEQGLTVEDASSYSQLYMCLGGANPIEPELEACAMADGDMLLLCSDGFWQRVANEEISSLLPSSITQEEGDRLTALAKERADGGSDNITLAIAEWRDAPDAGASLPKRLWAWLSRLFH